ncbi:cysteine desulfurase [Halosquirtibacter laminarini]|uniref:Cysteine desulfurase n=1 Tax=Halosquirtibacter laminarini TaxID=3374600 RepID=A0AC61NJH9_9BACT|nr:cysteine desulfurase [Prolixibacteraceae bacterium]
MIYLDYAASTPLHPTVLERMQEAFSKQYANPSNGDSLLSHELLQQISDASENILQAFGLTDHQVLFTSGATESINTILKGLVNHPDNTKNKIITSCTEHSAVIEVCKELESYGVEVVFLGNNQNGEIDLYELASLIDDQTLAVVLMGVNNETGLVHPVEQIADIAHEKGTLFLCDTTQTVGKVPIDYTKLDAFTISAHKIYGPKGIGALITRRNLRYAPLIHGGGQQGGMRAGTLPFPLIVALETAVVFVQDQIDTHYQEVARLQQQMEQGLSEIADIEVIAEGAKRSPYVSNILFPNIDIQGFKQQLSPSISFSSGSACKARIVSASRVIQALHLSTPNPGNTLRFSYGSPTTHEEIESALEVIKEAFKKI